MITERTPTVSDRLAALAIHQTLQHGAGVLWVDSDAGTARFVAMAQVEPRAFREMVQKTWEAQHSTHALVVLHQDSQLHMLTVPKAPRA